MEVAECVNVNTSVTDNMGRRGLHFRQRREVNVAKALGEDYNIENRRPSVTGTGLGTTGGTSGTIGIGGGGGGGGGSKYQPKIYIPERLKASMEGSKPASQSAAGVGMSPFGGSAQSAYNMGTPSAYGPGVEPAYNVGGTQPAYSGYSSRVTHGSHPAAADPSSSSILSTSRGLFQLRPRRCIRVKSFDELEMDENKRPPEETSGRQADDKQPTYTTGFLKDPASGAGGGAAGSRDRLARRGRHSISDMLGSSTMGLTPGFDVDGVPQGGHGVFIERPDFRLGLHDPGLDSPRQPAEDAVQEPGREDVARQTSEHVAPQEVIAGITELTENLNNLTMDGLVNGEERFAGERHLPDVISSQDRHRQVGYGDGVAGLRQNGYQTDGELTGGGSREETIDERKERIMRNLYAQKMAAASGTSLTTISDPNFETLEQKKERIFAALRQKHGVQIQTQMLGKPLLAEGWPVPNPLLPASGSLIGQPLAMDRPQTGHMLALDGPQASQSESSAFYASQSASRNEMPTGQSLHSRLADRERETSPADSYKDRVEMLNKDNSSTAPSDKQTDHLDLIDDNVQRLSPNEDMCSVDSGFHGGETGHEDSPGASSSTSGATPSPSAGGRQEDAPETKIETEKSKSEESSEKQNEQKETVVGDRTREEVKPDQSEDDSHDECLIKPSAVKAAGSMLLKKAAPPPTKPKPKPKAGKPSPIRLPSGQAKPQQARSGSQTPTKPSQARSQPPRPKSAPPNKSKSFANLTEVTNISLSPTPTSAAPAAGRRASTSSGGSDGGSAADSPFSRNSRLRSSTRAWELKQAERRAELAKNKSPSKPPHPAAGQTATKKHAGLSPDRSSTAAGSTPTPTSAGSRPGTPKRQLSVESTSSGSTAGDRQKNYDKPWRTGSVLATKAVGSFTIRSAQPDRSAGVQQQPQQPQRPRKPLSSPSSRSASRTQSPAGRPRQK